MYSRFLKLFGGEAWEPSTSQVSNCTYFTSCSDSEYCYRLLWSLGLVIKISVNVKQIWFYLALVRRSRRGEERVAAAAAKSLQSCPTLRPHRWQPTRLPSPWDSAGKNTGVGCHCLLQCMKVKSESEVTQSCPKLRNPMDCSLPGSASMGFSRQEYWGCLPLPSPSKESRIH